MLRSIFRLGLLVTLVKLHFGDGIGESRWPRFSSMPSSRRFSTIPVTSSPSPAPSPAPTPTLTSSPSSRRLLPSASRRFDGNGNNVQKSYPSADRQSPIMRQSRGGRFGNGRVPQETDFQTQVVQKNDPPPLGFLGLGSNNPSQGYTHTDQAPVEYSSGGGDNGGSMDIADQLDAYRREEEANDPDNKKINTDGEVIQQSLPGGRGDIVIKISGTNIVQKKMNQVREMLKESISFVFENTEFKTAVMARYM